MTDSKTTKLPFAQAQQAISQAERIMILCHQNPDGDAIGTALALKLALDQLNKQSLLICKDPIPDSLLFLPGVDAFGQELDTAWADLLLVCDVADMNKLSGFYPEQQAYFEQMEKSAVVIDHHPINDNYGAIRMVDHTMCASSHVAFLFFEHMNITITKDIATCLLTGMVTDTGSFQHFNTTPESLEVAAKLTEHGAHLPEIAEQVFNTKPLGMLKLWGIVLQRLQVEKESGVAWSMVKQSDFEQSGANKEDLGDIVTLMHGIPGAKMTVLLTEQENGMIKASLRTSEEVDASTVATFFGGGGHAKAAGFKVPAKDIRFV